MAQAYNLRIANGAGWPIFNMHTMAGLMNGWMVEFHWGMWQAGQKFFKGAPGPEKGKVKIPDAPGLGFTPDYDALAECRVKEPAGLKAGGMQTNEGGIVKV
jgi:L-alanine-DL-glutamate epimerase-like enolase superfamily enzyme